MVHYSVERDDYEWHRWFAWHPIKLKSVLCNKCWYHTTVWWEYVWRARREHYGGGWWEYSLYEPQSTSN